MNIYKYEDNINYQTEKVFPLVRKTRHSNYEMDPRFVIPEPPITFQENFVWLTHSPVTPNIMPYRYMISNYGRLYDRVHNGFKMPHNCDGGLKVKLFHYIRDNITTYFDVPMHRLVAFYFLYFHHCERFQVIHQNGDKTDNRVSNLRWFVTKEDQLELNIGDSPYIINAIPAVNYLNNLPYELIESICIEIINGGNNEDIAYKFGMQPNFINMIRYGSVYNDILTACFNKIYPNKYEEEKKVATKKMTDEQAHAACRALLNPNLKTIKEVCEAANCTPRQIRSLVSDKAYYKVSKIYRMEDIPKRKQK